MTDDTGSQRQITPQMRATWEAAELKERRARTILRLVIVVGALGVLWILVVA